MCTSSLQWVVIIEEQRIAWLTHKQVTLSWKQSLTFLDFLLTGDYRIGYRLFTFSMNTWIPFHMNICQWFSESSCLLRNIPVYWETFSGIFQDIHSNLIGKKLQLEMCFQFETKEKEWTDLDKPCSSDT